MSYTEYRDAFLKAYYDYQLESFLSTFNPNRPTVILLPGGMGSQLERTQHPFPHNPNVITDVIWVDFGIASERDALKAEIDSRGRDIDAHVVAAHGPLSFILATPYDELQAYAQRQGWNLAIFGFDWRRRVTESATLFKRYVREFRRRVIADHGKDKDPIPHLTIVCHSMGGLVGALAVGEDAFAKLGFNAIVTIGAPFYGASTSQDRYFLGDPDLLNEVYQPKTVARIVASLPGPYALMLLPKAVFRRDGAKLGLKHYPQRDARSNGDTDPFDFGLLRRWPKNVRDHRQYLVDARNDFDKFTAPINPNIAQVFFNVRSSLDLATAVELTWEDIDGDDVVPGTSPSPLTGVPGPGDGTVPAWSAFHAHCRSKNRYDLRDAKSHGSLLEHPETLALIDSIVTSRQLPTPAPRRRAAAPRVASRKEVGRGLDEWVARARRKQAPPAKIFDKRFQRGFVAALIAGAKPRMSRRTSTRSDPRK